METTHISNGVDRSVTVSGLNLPEATVSVPQL